MTSNCRGRFPKYEHTLGLYSLIYERRMAALNSKTDFKGYHAIQMRSTDDIATQLFE